MNKIKINLAFFCCVLKNKTLSSYVMSVCTYYDIDSNNIIDVGRVIIVMNAENI